MSDLTAVEKRRLEQYLEMGSGYVLDFSNRTFAEFVLDSTGLDIYNARYNYGSGSKANRLRGFWRVEDNRIVGKLLGDMLHYSSAGDNPTPLQQECRAIIARLLGNGSASASPAVAPPQSPSPQMLRSRALTELKDQFLELAAESDRRKAGFALEKLLNRLFEAFELQPRQPFRVVGEQIDGSFVLDSHIYLVEAKWEKDALPEAPLLVFRGKIEGKSTWTRGVFISLNDITAQARDAITRGKAPSLFVINGHDLMMVLSEAISLTDFLRKRVRLLAEEGRMCVPFTEVA